MKNEPGRGRAIGLTGGIACGKSEVGKILADQGAEVLEADEVAHALLEPGCPTYDQVVDRFGRDVLSEGGRIDRARLGKHVFENKEALRDLNAILHPPVLDKMQAWAKTTTAQGRHAVGIIPLLFEVGATDGWDITVCVVSDEETIKRRLAERGLAPNESEQRIKAQWPVEEKARQADVVIANNGTREELRKKTLEFYHTLQQKETKTS